MAIHELPPLPGVDRDNAPLPGEPGYDEWMRCTAVSPEGVDRGLIWEHLHRPPRERLAALQDFVDTVIRIRGGRRPEIL